MVNVVSCQLISNHTWYCQEHLIQNLLDVATHSIAISIHEIHTPVINVQRGATLKADSYTCLTE